MLTLSPEANIFDSYVARGGHTVIVCVLLLTAMVIQSPRSYAQDAQGTVVGAICADGSSHAPGFDCQNYLCGTGWAQSHGLGSYCPARPESSSASGADSRYQNQPSLKEQANTLYQQGISRYNDHQWGAAVSEFKAALADDPGNAQIQRYLDLAQNALSEQQYEENATRAQEQFLQKRDSSAALLKTEQFDGASLKSAESNTSDMCSHRSDIEQSWVDADRQLLDTQQKIRLAHEQFVQEAKTDQVRANNLSSDQRNLSDWNNDLDKLDDALDRLDDYKPLPPTVESSSIEEAFEPLTEAEIAEYKVLARGALAWTEVIIKSKAKYEIYRQDEVLSSTSQELQALSDTLMLEVTNLKNIKRRLKGTTNCDTTQLVRGP